MALNKKQGLIDGQHFYSKRNQVTYRSDKDCVRKKHFDQGAFNNELWVYERLSDHPSVKVPFMMSTDSKSLSLDLAFIHGSLILDELTLCETQGDVMGAVKHLGQLYGWMNRFYVAMGGSYRLNDVNLRNFIVHNKEIYGIDFEMVSEGNQLEEQCMVLAMYQMYDPEDTDFKKQVSEGVTKKYLHHLDHAQACISQCRETIEERRRNRS